MPGSDPSSRRVITRSSSDEDEAIRILMDYRPAAHGRGGIATYVRDLAVAYAEAFPRDALHLWAQRFRTHRGPASETAPPGARLHAGRLPSLAQGTLARFGFGPDRLVGGADVVHWTDYTCLAAPSAPVVATIHDVLFDEHPEWYTAGMVSGLRATTLRIVRRATRVIVPSLRTRDALVAYYPIAPDRIDVVAHGVRPLPPGGPAPGLGRYVLYVGTLEPRKNLARLLEAHRRLRQGGRTFHLVVAGPRGWMDDDVVDRIRRQPGVTWEGRVDRARLGALYRGASALAYPSLGEGFGLPVVEAMAEGCPVLVARGTVCAELAGDAGISVDAEDVDALADGLARLLDDPELSRALGGRGRERALPFTWERAARETRHSYEGAVTP